MNHKTRSILTVSVIFALMISTGILIGLSDTSMTGAAVKECRCTQDSDCNDNNPYTEDICLYAESCAASKCINRKLN